MLKSYIPSNENALLLGGLNSKAYFSRGSRSISVLNHFTALSGKSIYSVAQ